RGIYTRCSRRSETFCCYSPADQPGMPSVGALTRLTSARDDGSGRSTGSPENGLRSPGGRAAGPRRIRPGGGQSGAPEDHARRWTDRSTGGTARDEALTGAVSEPLRPGPATEPVPRRAGPEETGSTRRSRVWSDQAPRPEAGGARSGDSAGGAGLGGHVEHELLDLGQIVLGDLVDLLVRQLLGDGVEEGLGEEVQDVPRAVLPLLLAVEAEEGLVTEPALLVLALDLGECGVAGLALQELEEEAGGLATGEVPLAGEDLDEVLLLVLEDGGDELHATLERMLVERDEVRRPQRQVLQVRGRVTQQVPHVRGLVGALRGLDHREDGGPRIAGAGVGPRSHARGVGHGDVLAAVLLGTALLVEDVLGVGAEDDPEDRVGG